MSELSGLISGLNATVENSTVFSDHNVPDYLHTLLEKSQEVIQPC